MKTTSTLISLLIRFMNLRLPSATRTIPAFLFYLVFSLFSLNSAKASHIAGAYFSYECIGTNQYIITYNEIWRCNVTPSATAWYNTTNDCALTNLSSEPLTLDTVYTLTQSCPSYLTTCDGAGAPQGFQLAVYLDTITLPGPCASWQFYVSSCCTYTVSNQTASQSFYYETEMNSTAEACNNSTYPLNPGAPNYFTNEQVLHDFNFVDPDGDSLVYSLVDSRTAATTSRIYTSTYRGDSCIGNVQINSQTGEIAFNEGFIGLYIANIQIDEYRNGIQIGTTFYETFFTITAGVASNFAPDNVGISNVSGASQVASSHLTTCQSSDFSFDITFDDFNLGDVLSVSSNVADLFPGASITTTGSNPITATIAFDASAVTPGYYNISVKCQDDYCDYYKASTSVIGLTVFPDIGASLNVSNVTCYGAFNGEIVASALGGTSPFNYSADGSTYDVINTFSDLGGGTYTISIIDDNGCYTASVVNVYEPEILAVAVENQTDVTCFGGNDGVLEVAVSGGTISNLSYCLTGGPTSSFDSNLKGVNFGGENDTINFTGCPGMVGLSDNTNLSADLLVGSTYDLNVTFGTCGNRYNNVGEVWIDWNADGDFFDPGESVGQFGPAVIPIGDTTVTFSITVPASACNGLLRMRINQQEDFVFSGLAPPLNSCHTFSWGSSNDFSIYVLGGTCTSSAGYDYSVDEFINTQTTEIISSLASDAYVVSVRDVNGCIAIIPAQINEPTQYFALVDSLLDITCNGLNNGEVFAGVNVLEPTYCNATYSKESYYYGVGFPSDPTTGDYIDDFIIESTGTPIYQNLNSSSSSPNPNYSDFTSDTISLTPGSTYDFKAVVDEYSQQIVAFFDFNRDGDFTESDEYFYLGIAPMYDTVTAALTIPANVSGYVRMRIQSVWSGSAFSPFRDLSCGFITSAADAGEYEDYTVYLGNPYQYSFNGGGYQVSNNFSGLASGPFTIDVQDNYGCVESVSGSISEPLELLSTIAGINHESCETFNDGRILGGAMGGTAISGSNPYLYEVVGPTPLGPQTSNVFEDLSPGTYDLIVTDANSCTDTSAFPIFIGNTAPAPLSTNLDPAYYGDHPDIGLYATSSPIPTTTIGYTFAGDGIWSDTLHPSALADGTYEAIYNYYDGTCLFSDTASFSILASIKNILIPGKITPTIANPWVFCAGDAGSYAIKGLPLSKYGANFLDTSYVLSTRIAPPASVSGPFVDTASAVLVNLDTLAAGSYPIRFYSYVPVFSVDSVIGTSTFVGWDSVLTEQNFIIRQINPGTILGLEEDYCEGDSSSTLSVTNQSVFPPVTTGFAWGNTNGGFTGPSVGVDPIFYPDSIGSGDTTVVAYYVTDNQLYCSASTSFYVNYHPKPAISFTGINDTVCSYFSDTVLSSPSIGVFSNGIGLVSNIGVNAGSAVFDVNTGSNPTHWSTNLDYSWEYFPSCTVDSSMTITVMPDAATSFTVVDFMGDTVGLIDPLEICHNDSVTYFANSLGAPVSNGFFPWDLTTIGQAPLIGSNTSSVAEITEYPFEYTYDDGFNQCPYYDALDIEVYPLPTVAIIGLNAEYCSDEDSSALTLLPNSNGILTFYNGGIIDTISASPPYLNPAIFTVDTNFFVNYHYTDSLSGCVNDYLSAVNVNAGPIPLTSNIEPSYFSNHPDVGIYAIASPIPDFSVDYSFAGDGVWLDTLHPAALTPGIYDVIYNYIDGFCQFSDTSSFTINPAIENIIIPSKTVPSDPWIFCKGDLNMYEIKGIPLSRYGGNFVNSSYITAAYIPPALNLTGPFEDTLIATLSNIDGLAAGQYPIEFYSYIPVYSVDTAVGNSSFVEWDSVLVIKNFTIRQLVPGSILGLEVDYCEGEFAGLLSVSGQGAFPPVSTVSEWTHTNGGFSPSPSASDPIFAPTSIGSGDSTQVIYTISDDEGYCSASTQQMVYYHPEPVISFSGITDTVCSYFSDTVFCSPTIGVFSNGIGLVSNVGFNVGSAVFEVTSGASATHWTTNLDYSYVYFSGCTVDSSMLITVMPDATPSFTVVDFIGDTVTSISPLEMCHNDSVTYFANSLGGPVSNGYLPWDLTTIGQAPLIGNNVSSVTQVTEYPFEYTYDDGFNQCPYYDTLSVEVFPLPTIAILGLNAEYCSDQDSVALTLLPNNNGILSLTHDGGIDTLSSSAPYLNPGIYTSDTLFIANYHYTDSLSGCSNDYPDSIYIYESPDANFYVIDSCANNPTTFINISIGNATSFIWDLDDGGLASGDTAVHIYPNPGYQVIELTASSNNCTNVYVDSVNIGNTPLADFGYAYGCFDPYGLHPNAPAEFFDSSSVNSGPAISYWFWDFGEPGLASDTSVLANSSFSYQSAGLFDVSLYVENVLGCGDTIIKSLVVQPYYNLLDTITMPTGYQRSYFEDLESATPDWLIDDIAGVNSTWELGSPTGVINSAFSGSNAYVTSLSGSYNDNEMSYVYGPCFDLSRLKRPMIKLRTWSDVIDFGTLFGANDGARLEYYAGATGWQTLGNITDGINWYNGDSIYSGNPSVISDFLGWSGQDIDWKDSRYKLDEIRDGFNNDTLVRFRIAFNSDDLLAGGGFAFDNVWIGERKKRVLVEHFTNTEDPLSNTYQPDFDQLMDDNVLDAIDLQYHTEIPDGDLLWSDYPSGPNARTLYYSTSGVVPYSINDGILYRDSTQNWIADSAVFKANSLRDPGFIIDLTGTTIDAVSRVIDVRVKLEALSDYINENIRVHIAVIEDNAGVSGAQNVVRRMLPDAGGSILPVLSMFAYDTLSMDPQTWTVPASMDISNIMVVVFVQNYNTQEVYQCADNINYLIATDDAVEDANATTFRVFPNPAKYEATIAFNAPISESYLLEVFNGIGQKVDQVRMAKGTSRTSVSLQKYTAGMYIVRITANESVIGWSRLIKQ